MERREMANPKEPSERGRLVYSTGAAGAGETLCPTCAESAARCRSGVAPPEPVEARLVLRLRVETKGRGGKAVTVVDGLPANPGFATDLLRELKRTLGTGGALREGALELQGDCRERVRALLGKRGIVLKG